LEEQVDPWRPRRIGEHDGDVPRSRRHVDHDTVTEQHVADPEATAADPYHAVESPHTGRVFRRVPDVDLRRTVDLVLDADGEHRRAGGHLVSVRRPPLADLIYRDISLRSFFIVNWVRHTPRKQLEETYAELAHLVADDVLNAAVEATYPLTEYRTAARPRPAAPAFGQGSVHPETGRSGKPVPSAVSAWLAIAPTRPSTYSYRWPEDRSQVTVRRVLNRAAAWPRVIV
jgi:Zinc-binding dehydrogenase